LLIVLTSKLDAHADHVIAAAAGVFPVLRINTDNFLEDYEFALGISGDGVLGGFIRDHHGHAFDFAGPAVGWYRKPDFGEMAVAADPAFAAMVRSEAAAFVDALCALPNIHWINRPGAVVAARSKPAQLLMARQLGFSVPATLMTNSPDEAVSFAQAADGGVIVKSIHSAAMPIGGHDFACITKRLDAQMLDQEGGSIALCPTQLQEEIRKDCDIRVTVVGDTVFACRIDSQGNEATEVDWRVDPDACRYSVMDLPPWASAACREIVARAGLEYGAIDLIGTSGGGLFFLENNPGGQYLWIELDTGLPITAALIALFTGHMARF
jgi:glutathione synthase/RimK-type ligase-like ATP-grasp enzyme